MKVLVVGSGGREHALVWKLKQSPSCGEIICAPGNPGIGKLADCFPILAADTLHLADFAKEQAVDLVAVGPERPLANGLADELQAAGIPCFGPGEAGARIEWSKLFAKNLMLKWGIPTAPFAFFNDPSKAKDYIRKKWAAGQQVVVKADGLCEGKGVYVPESEEEALRAVGIIMTEKKFGLAGEWVVVEERLFGQELTIQAITDGRKLVILPPARDYKYRNAGDKGPMTGGMGAYAPVPIATEQLLAEIKETILQPAIKGFACEGIAYRGVLYAGLMIVEGKPYALEFNCRLGDPEAQAVLPVIDEDILQLFFATATGNLTEDRIISASRSAVCVVIASEGYGYKQEYPNQVITHLDWAADILKEDGFVFHSNTKWQNSKLVTNGGRVLTVTAWDKSLVRAGSLANYAASKICFAGSYFRPDIGYQTLHYQRST
ncbi:phosphoribosylamine--glycine ligase [Candidatus Falkowbacteria bacterium CG10_big_fil_rev_8_21_14_0_10_44_15]|uniref:Phosphoribosylamine--glycine ligase n=1 Tax=Candidatus Falkowbacteria bacterium CG10_big_fil_rev_8_21_14_0_10_44_15 TaxID=1974569 RepID=A0A2H0V0N7_9BACT|nr:MAG: phosphoribosylamine--glycine ligase [Candidatus Falkowbacteria bacterium CG10_big_fil_rev_8_21_14_0_10_44_15]